MAVSDLDIYRAANQVIKHYGVNALAHATERAAFYKSIGDDEGAGVWKRTENAISALLQPPAGPMN